MNESLHAYMKVGLIHFMAFPDTGSGPIEETIHTIAQDDYFDVVELTRIQDAGVRANVSKMLKTAGMDCAYGAQPILLSQGLNINSLDEEERQKALKALKEGIDEAYELDARGFAFLSGKFENSSIEESYRALVKSTRELCSYAASKGNMVIIHEIFDHKIDKKSLIGPAELARRYAEEICREFYNFGLMVDLSHIPLIGETIEEAILPVKDYLVHAHIGNCVVNDTASQIYGDQHPRFGYPGGENDVEQLTTYLQTLKDISFLNKEAPPFLSIEVKPINGECPFLTIANSKRVLNQAWARVC